MERDLRLVLRRVAGAPPYRLMPPGTTRRVRLRETLFAVTVAALVAAVALGTVGLIQVWPGHRKAEPAGGGAVATVTPPVVVHTPPPISPPAPGEWPVVTLGGDFTPYVDHVVDQNGVRDSGVVTAKTVIAYGTVQGVPWSLAAFLTDGTGDWTGPAGPCGELFLGAGGDYGGSGLCLNSVTRPRSTDLGLTDLVFGSGPITAYAGVVSDRVAQVVFHFDDGDARAAEMIPGPSGVDARYFVLFVPNGSTGDVQALSQDGRVLGDGTMCVPAHIESDANVGCS